MKNTELKIGMVVISPLKIVGIITNICEKENTVTIMWSDGSFTNYTYDDFEYYPLNRIGKETDEILLILLQTLLQTLTKIERLHNE